MFKSDLTRIDGDTWSALSSDAKRTWVKMPPGDRNAMSKYFKDSKESKMDTKANAMDAETSSGSKDESQVASPETSERDDDHKVTFDVKVSNRKTSPGDPKSILSEKSSKRRVNVHRFAFSNDSRTSARTEDDPRSSRRRGDDSQRSRRRRRKRRPRRAILDRGANGTVGGDGVAILEINSNIRASVEGIAGHTEENLPTGSIGAVVKTSRDPILGVWHHASICEGSDTIFSCIQMEDHGCVIDDRPRWAGGNQRVIVRGFVIPVDIIGGLPHLNARKPTERELRTLERVDMTSDFPWDPTGMNLITSTDEDWLQNIQDISRRDRDGYRPILEHWNPRRSRRNARSTNVTEVEEDQSVDDSSEDSSDHDEESSGGTEGSEECDYEHYNEDGYDLMSMGPDGKVGGDDDVTNWQVE